MLTRAAHFRAFQSLSVISHTNKRFNTNGPIHGIYTPTTPPRVKRWYEHPGGRGYQGQDKGHGPDTLRHRISKSLSNVLRHNAAREGLSMRSDGYVRVGDLVRVLLFIPSPNPLGALAYPVMLATAEITAIHAY